MRGQILVREEVQVRQAVPEQRQDMSRYRTEKSQYNERTNGDPMQSKPPVGSPQPQRMEPIRIEKRIGRNEPCPCGSGKKYKNCHGKGL